MRSAAFAMMLGLLFNAQVTANEPNPTERENDRLLVQATNQPRDVAIPASETHYFSRTTDAQITFVKNAAGRVDHLVIHQNGKDIQVRRK